MKEKKNLIAIYLSILLFSLALFLHNINISIRTVFLHTSFLLIVFGFYPSIPSLVNNLDLRINSKKDFLIGYISTFIFSILLVLVINIIFYFFGLGDSINVFNKIEELSFPILFLAIFVVPFTEELLFRGFFMNTLGAVFSSLIFALAHYSYGSITELFDTFALGYIFCFSRKRFGLYVPISVHLTINLLSILAVKFLGG